jgi:hypothetical protein
MRAWANYVNPVKAENVVPIHKRVSVSDFRRRPRSGLGGASPAGDSMKRSVATYLKRVRDMMLLANKPQAACLMVFLFSSFTTKAFHFFMATRFSGI